MTMLQQNWLEHQKVPMGMFAPRPGIVLTSGIGLILVMLGMFFGAAPGNATGDPQFLSIIEIQIEIDGDYDGPRAPAWDFRQRRDGSGEWSLRGDLYESDAAGWVFVRIDAANGVFRSAAWPLFHDEFTVLDLNEISWRIALRDGQLHIVRGDGEAEAIRVLLPGDILSNVQRPDVRVVFHSPVERDRFLLFRIFIDFEPPGAED